MRSYRKFQCSEGLSFKHKTLAIETVEEKCPFFSKHHDIDECRDLKRLTIGQRSKTFFRRNLCFGSCKLINMDKTSNLPRKTESLKFVMVHTQQ